MLVSRAEAPDAAGFRTAAGAGEFDTGGVCVSVVDAPAALRFFEVTPGVDSLPLLPFALAELLSRAWRAACFVPDVLGPVEVVASAAGFFFVVAADEVSKSMSWSSA